MFSHVKALSLEGLDSLRPDIDSSVFGAGKLLLSLVVLREYLERSPQDDDEVARIVIGTKRLDPVTEKLVYKSEYRLLRHVSISEYVLASIEGDEIQSDSLDILDLSRSHLSTLGVEIRNDFNIIWNPDSPLAFIALVEGTLDEVQYPWPQPISAGLVGSGTLRKCSDRTDSQSKVPPAMTEVPRPRMRQRQQETTTGLDHKRMRTSEIPQATGSNQETIPPIPKRLRRSSRNQSGNSSTVIIS